MTDYIKTRKDSTEKFMQGFAGRELTSEPVASTEVEDPDVVFSKREGKVRAEIGLPMDADKESIMFKDTGDEFYVYFQMLNKDQYFRMKVLLPDGVHFEKGTAEFKDGVLIAYFL